MRRLTLLPDTPLLSFRRRPGPSGAARLLLAWTVTLLPALAVADPGSGLSSTFDADLEGWTVNGDNVVLWNALDGNPDGCLEVQDDAAGPWSVAEAPAAWSGNYSGFTSADSLIFEAIHVPVATQSGNPPYLIRLEGPGGVAEWDPPISIPPNSWNRFAAPFDSSEWDVMSGSWDDVLQNVERVLLAAEMITGDEVVRLDNICLTQAPSTSLYQECELVEFELGIPGWTGVDATVSSLGDHGDAGDFLRVRQTSPTGRLIAPSWWSGDWSGLDGDGTISFSFTFLGDSIEPGRELVVTMSGPGGAAEVRLSTDGYVLPNRLWHRFAWPIESSTWTVTSGTWGALLTDVTELSVSCDYSAGTDDFGLDNFVRAASGCASAGEPALTFHEPGYSLCDAIPFREACALARNPADGFLYATVDASVAAEGGVFRLEGPAPGSRIVAVPNSEGLVFTADGDGFVSENNAGIVTRFVGTDSAEVWLSEFQPGDDDPAGLLVAPAGFNGPDVSAGDLLITDHGNGGDDGIWVASTDVPDSERLLIADPGSVDWFDLATDGRTVWASDSVDDDLLWTLHPDGTTTTTALSQNVNNKRALVFDPAHQVLYTTRTSGGFGLWRIDPSTGQMTLIVDGFDGFGTGNLEIDPAARKIWVADDERARIYEICLPPPSVSAPTVAAGPSPLQLRLWPNPLVHGDGHIQLGWRGTSAVRVDIVDAAGRRVRSFAPHAGTAETYSVTWDRTDGRGRPVPSGVYFIRARAGDEVRTAKAVVLR